MNTELKGLDLAWDEVRKFHEAFGHPAKKNPTTMVDMRRAITRAKWINEEITEFLEAVVTSDIVEQADAMIDVIYFALGTLVEIGVKPQRLFEIVQYANMSKLFPDGKPKYREDGKIIKPEGWIDPHNLLKEEIGKQWIEQQTWSE